MIHSDQSFVSISETSLSTENKNSDPWHISSIHLEIEYKIWFISYESYRMVASSDVQVCRTLFKNNFKMCEQIHNFGMKMRFLWHGNCLWLWQLLQKQFRWQTRNYKWHSLWRLRSIVTVSMRLLLIVRKCLPGDKPFNM